MSLTLVLGGARSGKSQRAEALAHSHPGPVYYVATAPRIPGDAEWETRVETHRKRRPADWETHEVPLELTSALGELNCKNGLILVDCLTLWLSNQMHACDNDADGLEKAINLLVQELCHHSGRVLVVSNDVGSGVVPASSLGRGFRDSQGLLNQRVAAVADCVELMVAGLVVTVKETR